MSEPILTGDPALDCPHKSTLPYSQGAVHCQDCGVILKVPGANLEAFDGQLVNPLLLAAIYKGYLRAMFYQRLPHGETFGDVLFREDYKLHDAILEVVRKEI